MYNNKLRVRRRVRRRRGIRKGVYGTSERPRLTVFRSLQHIYAQIIDDDQGLTLCSASTRQKDLDSPPGYGGNIAAAKVVGEALAAKAKDKQISQVCFDRNGYRFHGRVRALALAAEHAGLKMRKQGTPPPIDPPKKEPKAEAKGEGKKKKGDDDGQSKKQKKQKKEDKG